MKTKILSMVALAAAAASAAVPFKNGTRFSLNDVPGELVVERRVGEPVRFALEENGTTGYLWAAEWNTNECDVVLEHRGAATRNGRGELLCGAAGTLDVAVTSKIYTPARNFDPSPKDLSRWLEAITWLDLKPSDIWMPRSKQ